MMWAALLALLFATGDEQMNQRVAQWADEFEAIRAELGLDPKRYPLSLGLAETEVESSGDPKARRPGSQFNGLLQMGWMAGVDVGYPKASPARNTTRDLHGNPIKAIRMWYTYMERYSARWGYEGAPLHLTAAILWKGGAGTARRIRDALRAGQVSDVWEGARWIESHPNQRVRIPNLIEYMRRIDRAHARWERWVAEEYQPGTVEPPTDLSGALGLVASLLGGLARRLS